MGKEFIRNVIFLIAVNLIIKPFYVFGIDRTVQNTVQEGTYGLYAVFVNLTFLLSIIGDFGLQNYNNRNIAQHRFLIHKYFPGLLILKSFLSLAFFVILIITANILGYSVDVFPLLLLIGLNQVLVSFILFLRSNISGLGFYWRDSLISVLDKTLLIFVTGYLLWFEPSKANFQIEWFVQAQTFTLILTAIIAFGLVKRRLFSLNFSWKPRIYLVILKKSYPFALIIFLMTAYSRIDSIMIERLLPNGRIDADFYASAYRLLDASNMIGFLFAGLLLPMFSRMFKLGENPRDLVRLSLGLIWSGAIALAIATFFFRIEIMAFLYVGGNAYSSAILGWLILSFIAVSGTYIYGTLLTAHGSLTHLNTLFLVGLILNFLMNLVWIPSHKGVGAAQATCITQFLMFGGQVYYSIKLVGLKVDFKMILKPLFYIGILIVSALLIREFTLLPWGVNYLIILAIGLVASIGLRLLDLEKIIFLISEKKQDGALEGHK